MFNEYCDKLLQTLKIVWKSEQIRHLINIVYEKGWETRSKNLDKQKIGYKVFTNFGGGGITF